MDRQMLYLTQFRSWKFYQIIVPLTLLFSIGFVDVIKVAFYDSSGVYYGYTAFSGWLASEQYNLVLEALILLVSDAIGTTLFILVFLLYRCEFMFGAALLLLSVAAEFQPNIGDEVDGWFNDSDRRPTIQHVVLLSTWLGVVILVLHVLLRSTFAVDAGMLATGKLSTMVVLLAFLQAALTYAGVVSAWFCYACGMGALGVDTREHAESLFSPIVYVYRRDRKRKLQES
ncbi:MAG: hypothetical protein AAGD01_14750 [Acidobacteriota bacterium]